MAARDMAERRLPEAGEPLAAEPGHHHRGGRHPADLRAVAGDYALLPRRGRHRGGVGVGSGQPVALPAYPLARRGCRRPPSAAAHRHRGRPRGGGACAQHGAVDEHPPRVRRHCGRAAP